jgi:glycosyltransferase involved in cell wall biosynthesis
MQTGNCSPASVCFVIRTYNEEAYIGRVLSVLQEQEDVTAVREVIIVDSGSNDRTVAIAQQWPVKLLRIPKEEFDYSEALNLGIGHSQSEIIINLSAHAIPSGTTWLARMVSHFSDSSVAGVYCRQLPWPDAPSREVRRIKTEFGEKRFIYDRMPLDKRVPFTNSAGCIRRSLWERHRFRLPWGEDFEWATWAVANGYKIVYEPEVSVYHSHNLTCRQAAGRLINSEKSADLELDRQRTMRLTLRQAAGHVYRDLKELLSLGKSEPGRFRMAWESIVRAYWFLWDFGR